MEKAESLKLPTPVTHCGYCNKFLRGKKDRRKISQKDGLNYISGQIVLIGDTKMIGAKFACQKCFGKNNCELTVLRCLATLCDNESFTFFLPHNNLYVDMYLPFLYRIVND